MYYAAGRKVSETFTRKAQAQRWLAAQEATLSQGTHVDPRGGRVLLGDWAAAWRQTWTGKPSSLAAKGGRLDNHVLPALGMLPLAGITPLTVRQWAARVGEQLAPKTVRHCHALLHEMMDAAVTERLIATNPCAGTSLPTVVREDPVFLSAAELAALVEAMDSHYRPLVLTLAGTGLRWGEAVGLRAGMVDLGRAELQVRWTWSDGFGWQPSPKTDMSRRTVTLPPELVDVLGPLVIGKGRDEAVFTGRRGGTVRHSMFTGAGYPGRPAPGPWVRAVRDAGLVERRPTPHDLRHSHASMLIAARVPLTAIQRRLGHRSIATTSDIYGHLAAETDVELLDAVGVALGAAASGIPTTSPQAGRVLPFPQVRGL